MPVLRCFVSDDDLRFLREEANRRGSDPERLAEAAIENAVLEARRERHGPRCPRCNSPDPKRHPALQFEGEVEPCTHPFHNGGSMTATAVAGNTHLT